MTIEEIAEKVADIWMGMIQNSVYNVRNTNPQCITPSQETIDEFKEDLLKKLIDERPRSLFYYSFVGLKGYEDVSRYLPWKTQTSTIIDWRTGKIKMR